MNKFETKATQVDKGIFTHILAYSDIFKHEQIIGIFRTLCNPSIQKKKHNLSRDILRTVAFSEQRYIQNTDIFRTLAYSKPCQTSTVERFRKNSQRL